MCVGSGTRLAISLDPYEWPYHKGSEIRTVPCLGCDGEGSVPTCPPPDPEWREETS